MDTSAAYAQLHVNSAPSIFDSTARVGHHHLLLPAVGDLTFFVHNLDMAGLVTSESCLVQSHRSRFLMLLSSIPYLSRRCHDRRS